MCDKMTNTRFDYYTKQEMLQVRDFIIEFSLEPYKTARLKSSCVCPPPPFQKILSYHRNKLLTFDDAFSVVVWYSAQT